MFDIAIVDDEFIFLKQFKDNLNEFFLIAIFVWIYFKALRIS